MKHLLFGLLMLIIFASYIIYNQHVYSEIHPLIIADEITPISSHYTNANTGETLYIDHLDNETYITVGSAGYVVPNDKFFDILSRYNSVRRKKSSYSPRYHRTRAEFSISMNFSPRHIVLGESNYWYESADEGIYEIIDGDKLFDEIKLFVEGSDVEKLDSSF